MVPQGIKGYMGTSKTDASARRAKPPETAPSPSADPTRRNPSRRRQKERFCLLALEEVPTEVDRARTEVAARGLAFAGLPQDQASLARFPLTRTASADSVRSGSAFASPLKYGHSMKVGVYVDAFNLYYGVRKQVESVAPTPSWKWIDLRALAARYANWTGAGVERVVYCTARVNDPADPAQTQRQDWYLRALRQSGSVDLIEEGYYSSWAKESVMTQEASGTRTPTPLCDTAGAWQWSPELHLRRNGNGTMFATVRKREEKGSDVNVATHLMVDVLQGDVDAAIVISNDSDLALPIRIAREHVPVGLINPGPKPLAGALTGNSNDGVGRHWWRRLAVSDVLSSQLPDPVGGLHKPASW